MGMFRDETESPHIGIGTYVTAGQQEQFLIVQNCNGTLGVLDMIICKQMSLLDVQDPTWITREEFTALFSFSDHSIHDFKFNANWVVNLQE